ncbi:MAG: class I SAM-dependent methyltransferase [Chloroflexota bacterium]
MVVSSGNPSSVGSAADSELSRVREYYAARDQDGLHRRYSPFNPGHLLGMQQLERAMLAAIDREAAAPLADLEILDVGCGDGWFLRRLASLGATRSRLHGVDAIEARVASSRAADGGLDVCLSDGAHLPFGDGRFDLIVQMMVLSSVLDGDKQRALAGEMSRVLAPNGVILSYDFRIARDRANTRAVRRRDLEALFPGFACTARSVTLLPPLARALAPYSWALCEMLSLLPVLRGHELAVLRRNGDAPRGN